jgi:hypothetical protein
MKRPLVISTRALQNSTKIDKIIEINEETQFIIFFLYRLETFS